MRFHPGFFRMPLSLLTLPLLCPQYSLLRNPLHFLGSVISKSTFSKAAFAGRPRPRQSWKFVLCPHCSLRPPCPLFSGPISHSGFFSRLKQLDKHGQATAQQLVQLLNKQNQLLQERQSLSEEVGRLRAQVPCRAGLPAREHAGLSGVLAASCQAEFPPGSCCSASRLGG